MAVNDFLAEKFHKIRLLKQSVRGAVWLAEDSAGHFVVWKETTVTGLPYNILKKNPYRLWPTVLYYCETEKGSVIIEEYINGENISDRLANGKQFSKSEVMSILWQLVDGLIVLHKLGIIHRDIKPGNLIWQSGNIYLIDFETARQPKKESESDTCLLGTRGYAAPEQFGFAQTDVRSDIYSLGVTLKEIAGPDISPELAELLQRCTALDPAQRFQSVAEIRSFWQNRQRNHYLKIAGILFFCLLAAVIGWQSGREEQKIPDTPAPIRDQQLKKSESDKTIGGSAEKTEKDIGSWVEGNMAIDGDRKGTLPENNVPVVTNPRLEQTIYLNGEPYDKPHIVFTSDEYRKWPRLAHDKQTGHYSMMLPGEWDVRMHIVNRTGETVRNLQLEIEYDTAPAAPNEIGSKRRKEYIAGKSLAPGEEMDFEWSFTNKIIMNGPGDCLYRIFLRIQYEGEYDVWDCAAGRYGGKNSDITLSLSNVNGYNILDETILDPRKTK